MAYKSLYRAYRPQTFADVSGQQAIIKTLQNAVDENKIAHAYLFCGPRGTGKTTVAKLLAKAINCENTPKPCGYCDNCKEIEYGTHPDVIEIDAASNNGVGEVRDLIEKVKFAPSKGRYKVYIIDEVHMMSDGAFNALLKTLEEPPAHVIFILATTEPHKILPTIISRCQRFDFSRLTEQEMVDRMKVVIKEENCVCDEAALMMIAKLANGGMRDALSILEQCLAYNDDHLTEQEVNSIYGIVSMDDKINFIKTLLSSDMNKALQIVEKMLKSGTDIKRLTYDLVDILKDVVIYRNTSNVNILSVLTLGYIESIVPYLTSDEALHFIDLLMAASEKYAYAAKPDVYFELAVLKMCNEDHNQQVVVKEVVKNDINEEEKEEPVIEQEIIKDIIEPETVEQTTQQEIKEEPPHFEFEEKEEPAGPVEESVTIDQDDIMNILVQANRGILNDIQEKWSIISRYRANMNTARAATMLSAGKPVAACADAIVLSYEHMPDVNAVNHYSNYPQLSSLIKDVFSHEYQYIAMQEDEWLSLRTYYIKQMRQNALPQARPITLKHIERHHEQEKILTPAQKYAIEMFGEDLVEFIDK